jgi:hypothetical protein
MTTTLPAAQTRSTATAPTVRDLWRRGRWAALGLVGALLVIAVVAALTPHSVDRPFDPQGTGADGAHAAAVLLAAHGVHVVRVADTTAALAAADDDTTLVVTRSDLLGSAGEELAGRPAGSLLVLVEPDPVLLTTLVDGVVPLPFGPPPTTRSPGCPLLEAVVAGNVTMGGGFTVGDAAGTYTRGGTLHGLTSCYPAAPGPALVHVGPVGRGVTAVADGTFLTNGALDKGGDAALLLGLLGHHRTVVWLAPTQAAVDAQPGGQAGLTDLLPPGVPAAVLGLLAAGGVLALARGRRVGAIVTEPLPVVVRAAETVEGRARLYRSARARDRAATVLRRDTAARLAPLLSGPAPAGAPVPQALVASVSAATGRDPAEIAALLAGPTPRDDTALLRLAYGLDDLVDALRDPMPHPPEETAP